MDGYGVNPSGIWDGFPPTKSIHSSMDDLSELLRSRTWLRLFSSTVLTLFCLSRILSQRRTSKGEECHPWNQNCGRGICKEEHFAEAWPGSQEVSFHYTVRPIDTSPVFSLILIAFHISYKILREKKNHGGGGGKGKWNELEDGSMD